MWILSKKYRAFVILLLVALGSYGQPMASTEAEYGYFIFPVNPGIRNTLAGTMGELRSSHFHTGIDIRTGGREGLAVLAAADGYVSRIKVSAAGYGNTVYVKHPNGKTTVYAHLKSFRPDLSAYVKEAQYKKQSFEVNLFPKVNQFKVSRGDTLALSGNSGSSGGPHLHFDIRDENQHLLNPLNYGFQEVVDTRTPYAKAIALTTFAKDARISGEFGRQEFALVAHGNEYRLPDTLEAFGQLGLELYAWDRMNGTRFKTGINKITFTLNGKEIFGQHINSWSFARARSFYQHINYPVLVTTGQRYHKLYIDNGNTLQFYDRLPSRGQFTVEKGKSYQAEITLSDSYGNTSTVRFVIRGSEAAAKNSTDLPNSTTILKNTLKIVGDSTGTPVARLVSQDKVIRLPASYHDARGYPVFLWDLRQALPKAVGLADTTLMLDLISRVPPGREYKVFSPYADIVFTQRSLFDTLYFTLAYKFDSVSNTGQLSIGNPQIPLKGSVQAVLKFAGRTVDKEHAAVYQVTGKNNYAFAGGTWKENRIEVKLRNFGTYTIIEDSIAPTVKPLIITNEKIVFKLDDKLSGIKEVRATLDNKWLLIAKDPKKKLYWAESRYPDEKFTGKLVLKVTDNANNTRTYTTKIN